MTKRFYAFFLVLLLFFCPFAMQADEVYSIPQEIESIENVDIVEEIVVGRKQMTQKEIDELLGEDPYLGPTSWLGAKIEKKE